MRIRYFYIVLAFLSQIYYPSFAQEDLAIAHYKGKAGFINRSGDWHIKPVFDEVTGFENGLAAVRSERKWGYINTRGEYAIPGKYDNAEPFENGSFTKVESDHRSFYIGRDGEIVSESDTGVVIFYEDLAILDINGRYGYITRDNEWKIKPRYEMAWPFKDGYAKVKKNGEWIYINKQGEEVDLATSSRSIISPVKIPKVNRQMANGKWGFTDNQGKWLINPRFDYAGSFSDGLAPVQIANQWGYIDTLGSIKIPFEYEEAYIFTNGLASVRIKGKYGSIDKSGNLVIKAKFDNPLFFYHIKEYSDTDFLAGESNIKSMRSITIPDISELADIYVPKDKRLALVIGNGNYSMGGYLVNPENDARSMAETLKNLGFVVRIFLDVNQLVMKQAIDDFGEMLKDFDVGLFFYAGHGLQVKGYNYLVPVGASIASERDVEYNCVEAGRVLGAMEDSGCKVNIVILDACRNNPYERSWTRSAGGQGLAFMNAPSGSLIAYATAPGRTASDGTGANGLFTSSLLKYIKMPGITILEVFQNVRSEVRLKSGNEQTPWESTSLEGNFYFKN